MDSLKKRLYFFLAIMFFVSICCVCWKLKILKFGAKWVIQIKILIFDFFTSFRFFDLLPCICNQCTKIKNSNLVQNGPFNKFTKIWLLFYFILIVYYTSREKTRIFSTEYIIAEKILLFRQVKSKPQFQILCSDSLFSNHLNWTKILEAYFAPMSPLRPLSIIKWL